MNAVRDGNHIRIYNAFMIKESIKEIDGRFYNADDKAWLVPFSKENAALLGLLGVTLGDGLMDAINAANRPKKCESLLFSIHYEAPTIPTIYKCCYTKKVCR